MAEPVVYKRRRAIHSSDLAEAGNIKVASTDESNEKSIVYKRRKLLKKQLDGVDEAGMVTVASADRRDEKIIVYGRRKPRMKQLDDVDEDGRIRTLSTDNRQDARIGILSMDKGHEQIIVYKRRNFMKMQLKGLAEAQRNTTIATYERCGTLIQCKRQMLKEHQLVDLPEEILGSIISCLPLRDAVRTSILSTKMRRIWTCHPNLYFTNQTMFPGNKIKGIEQKKIAMIEGMQAVLQQHKGSGVESIVIKALLDHRTSSVLNTCIKFASTSGTKHLSLLLSPERPYCFPTHLFDKRKGSESVLEELYLKFVSLRIPPGFNGFTQLKRLELSCIYDIGDDELQDLLKNCLLLECLYLNMLFKFDKILFSQALSNLRCLSITGCHKVKIIEIAAANLESFKYEGWGGTNIVFTKPLQKVRYASIQYGTFDSRVGEFVLSVLPRTLPKLETLVWKTEGIEMDELPNCIGRFHCLETVQIELCAIAGPYGGDVLSFAALLDAAPLLKSFSLKLIGFVTNQPYAGIEEFRRLPSSPHHHLKSVRIQEFTCLRDQIELVEYILDNATALEDVIIKSSTGSYKEAALESTYLRKDERMVIL